MTLSNHTLVDLIDADYGDAATALGAQGFEVHTLAELHAAFAAALKAKGPVVIDVKVTDLRPIPVEQLVLDKQTQDPAAVDAFVEKYSAQALIPLRALLEQEGEAGKGEDVKMMIHKGDQ